MRSRAATTVLILLMSTLPALLAQSTFSSASANECLGSSWTTKTRVVERNRKDLSSVYSKRNSNRSESADLSVGLTTSSSDSSELTASTSASLGNVIAQVEATYGVSITRSVSRGVSITNTMRVMPLRYGRTKWQTVRTVYEKYRYRYAGAACSYQKDVIWRARLITSRVHFAECQDKTNTCRPY